MAVEEEVHQGFVMDVACPRKAPADELLGRASAHTTACALMGHCIESGFVLVGGDGPVQLTADRAGRDHGGRRTSLETESAAPFSAGQERPENCVRSSRQPMSNAMRIAGASSSCLTNRRSSTCRVGRTERHFDAASGHESRPTPVLGERRRTSRHAIRDAAAFPSVPVKSAAQRRGQRS